jgi:hypothetical protein
MTDETELMATNSSAERKAYRAPAIVHELKLETRAGSPPGGPELTDPLGIDPTKPQVN